MFYSASKLDKGYLLFKAGDTRRWGTSFHSEKKKGNKGKKKTFQSTFKGY